MRLSRLSSLWSMTDWETGAPGLEEPAVPDISPNLEQEGHTMILAPLTMASRVCGTSLPHISQIMPGPSARTVLFFVPESSEMRARGIIVIIIVLRTPTEYI